MAQQVKIFAHRGASGHALENSFKAFDKAIRMKVDGIEIDLQCSKDGRLYVFHDLNLHRLTGVNRFFYDCLSEEITAFKIGKRYIRHFTNVRIPSVEAFMEWLTKNPVCVNIELKESILKHKETLISWLLDLTLPPGSHFSSFYPDLLKIVKQVRPDYDVAILVTKEFKWTELKSMQGIDAVHAHKKYYRRPYLKLASEAQKPIRFYGIKGDEPFLRHPHPIVVGWITDYPKKVAAIVK